MFRNNAHGKHSPISLGTWHSLVRSCGLFMIRCFEFVENFDTENEIIDWQHEIQFSLFTIHIAYVEIVLIYCIFPVLQCIESIYILITPIAFIATLI